MQTLTPSLCFAMVVGVAACHNSRTSSNPNRRLNNLLCLAAVRLNGASVIGLGHQITSVRFACQPGHSFAAVRFSKRREMLSCRAKLVRRSRFAPAAKPPVSSSRATPRRSVSIARNAQAAETNTHRGQSRSARLARQTQAVFNRVTSLPANAANALPNHSLNRTHCGVPSFAPSFHSGSNAVTPQCAG